MAKILPTVDVSCGAEIYLVSLFPNPLIVDVSQLEEM
jgi:hypothetical protein